MVPTYFLSGYHTHPNLSRLFYCFNPDRLLEFSSKPITDRMGRGIKAKQNQKEKKETETEWLVLRKKKIENERGQEDERECDCPRSPSTTFK